ncbi:MAG: DUF4199 family protein [Flavobacteriales bacterium]|jgi:hypothetical protein|nr:DUF4199 family protein [Flavobacteriales bacterium]MBT4738037.1 DUF4199 family protein [Flavobacteriales bacterium]MBT6699361.1 DUF4199 family protein [Flavobacteriales bacterium]MBT6816116.1 DUF4199 family protein [Flavobacteriales bacterium]MBT7620734.1 DUF4199 family protein [Flavobacteriales bacterium]
MEKQEKAFILNKGLILGLVLMFFPIIDLFYGLDMNWINYILIFGLLWMVVYSYLVVKWSKEFASYYEIFPFKDAFRTLFLISAVAFGVLTVGKTLLWTVSFPEKYIEINMQRQLEPYKMIKSMLDEQYLDGSINGDDYEKKINNFESQNNLIVSNWETLRSEGLGVTYFLQLLIFVLFIISIYCAILAFFVRKKENFIKTN